MAYMLLILEDPAQRGTRNEADGHAVYDRMLKYADDLKKRGVLLGVESLTSQRDAERIKVAAGKSQVIDGPFAEAKEMVGASFSSTAARARKRSTSRSNAPPPNGRRSKCARPVLAIRSQVRIRTCRSAPERIVVGMKPQEKDPCDS